MIDDLIEEYKIHPYKQFGNELAFYFGEQLRDTDKWMTLPFKEKSSFIDFAQGLNSTNKNPLPPLDFKKHTSPDFTGFVALDPERTYVEIPEDQFAYVAYIQDGKFRYIQSKTFDDDKRKVIFKGALFLKNKFALRINSLDAYNRNYECIIQSSSRESFAELEDDYQINILQTFDFVSLLINKKNKNEQSYSENTIYPLIELRFRNEKYFKTIEKLSLINNQFENLSMISYHFGTEEISPASQLIDILEEKQGISINRNQSMPTLNDCIRLMNYFSSKKEPRR